MDYFHFLIVLSLRFKNEYCFYNQKTFFGKKHCNSFGSSMGGWVVQEGRPEGWAAGCSKVTIGTGKEGKRKEAQPQVTRPILHQGLHNCKQWGP